MNLTDLIQVQSPSIRQTIQITGREDIKIQGLSFDSRNIKPGFLFAALRGQNSDGSQFIADAVRKGATVLLVDYSCDVPDGPDVCVVRTDNPRRLFSCLAASYYAKQPKNMVAVTGTNGKSSTVHFVRRLWEIMGFSAASLGTLGVGGTGFRLNRDFPHLTTLDPVTFFDLMAELATQGVDHLAFEASSHGLDQYRIDGCQIRAAGFTQLSRDHLDYHGTMEHYYQAKKRLFTDVLASDGCAVLNMDDTNFADLRDACDGRGIRVISYGHRGDLAFSNPVIDMSGICFDLQMGEHSTQVRLNCFGSFQIANFLCALGLVLSCDRLDWSDVKALVEQASDVGTPKGRLEWMGTTPMNPHGGGGIVFVDFAHTPDGLESVLQALRPHCRGDLVVLFGCGGNRDPGKRGMMGEVAKNNADRVIITDDNPRFENPTQIRQAILSACPGALDIPDRKRAIAYAMRSLKPGDVLLIAGKGHETGQIIGEQILPFSDQQVVNEIMEAMKKSTQDR